jgi:hypothetical protein
MSAAMLIAVGGGAMSALCYGAAVIGTLGALLLMLLSQLPLFLVGLNQGTRGVLAKPHSAADVPTAASSGIRPGSSCCG